MNAKWFVVLSFFLLLVSSNSFSGGLSVQSCEFPPQSTDVNQSTSFIFNLKIERDLSVKFELKVDNQFSDSLSIFLKKGEKAIKMRWSPSRNGRHNLELKICSEGGVSYFWGDGPFGENGEWVKGFFYTFGPKKLCDFLINDFYPEHTTYMKEALLSIDQGFLIEVVNYGDMGDLVAHAKFLGTEALVQSDQMAIHAQNFLHDSTITMFAPMPFNQKLYWDYYKEQLKHVVTSSTCDENGSIVYCFGPALEFVDYYSPANFNSYVNCIVAAKCYLIKKKLENYFGEKISWNQVRQVAHMSTGNLTKSDSIGYGRINMNYDFVSALRDLNLARVEKKDIISTNFYLNQNYPNPFNPATTVKYSVPRNSHVSLTIYNIRGQKVVVLQDGEQSAGEYSKTWNASNVPSGTYFAELVVSPIWDGTGNVNLSDMLIRRQVIKMQLLK